MSTELLKKPEPYERVVLESCKDFEIVRCRWKRGAVSPLHGHGVSRCVLLVKEGRFENRTDFGFKSESITLSAGESLTIPIGAKHEIICLSESGESIHIYTPRLDLQSEASNFVPLSSAEILGAVDIEVGDEGTDLGAMKEVIDKIKGLSIDTASPLFMNQLFAGIHPQNVLAQELITQTRATLATSVGSPILTEIERHVVQKLGKVIGWSGCEGLTVPGGSAANFMAVHCARHRRDPMGKKNGHAPVGGDRSKNFKVYVSEEGHYSISKAAVVLGLGQRSVEIIPCDSAGRMLAHTLEERISANMSEGATPLIIVATAGTTVLGAFDPIEALAVIARAYGVWLHVDAAWGAPALFCDSARGLVAGVQSADSVAIDIHKFFGGNLAASFFLTKDEDILLAANDVAGGEYLFHEKGGVDRGRMSWQCGRGADAVSFWSLWKHLGTRGLGATVDRFFTMRDELVTWIESQARLRLVAVPTFLNICVEVLPPENIKWDGLWSQQVRNSLIRSNTAMVNFSTSKDGVTFLRLVLAHPFLQLSDLTNLLTSALEVDD